MLDPVGILSDGPTIQWTIQESLVAATEATHQGVQDLLHRCVMSQTPALQLDSNTSIPCGELSRQLDAPPLMTILRRRSRVTHETVSGELAREFRLCPISSSSQRRSSLRSLQSPSTKRRVFSQLAVHPTSTRRGIPHRVVPMASSATSVDPRKPQTPIARPAPGSPEAPNGLAVQVCRLVLCDGDKKQSELH